jgi:hypothetical protein
MRLSQSAHAEVIARLSQIEEHRLAILDILLPPDAEELGERVDAGEACVHPSDAIEDRSTFDEERYHCTTCGADFSQHPRTLNPEE